MKSLKGLKPTFGSSESTRDGEHTVAVMIVELKRALRDAQGCKH